MSNQIDWEAESASFEQLAQSASALPRLPIRDWAEAGTNPYTAQVPPAEGPELDRVRAMLETEGPELDRVRARWEAGDLTLSEAEVAARALAIPVNFITGRSTRSNLPLPELQEQQVATVQEFIEQRSQALLKGVHEEKDKAKAEQLLGEIEQVEQKFRKEVQQILNKHLRVQLPFIRASNYAARGWRLISMAEAAPGQGAALRHTLFWNHWQGWRGTEMHRILCCLLWQEESWKAGLCIPMPGDVAAFDDAETYNAFLRVFTIAQRENLLRICTAYCNSLRAFHVFNAPVRYLSPAHRDICHRILGGTCIQEVRRFVNPKGGHTDSSSLSLSDLLRGSDSDGDIQQSEGRMRRDGPPLSAFTTRYLGVDRAERAERADRAEARIAPLRYTYRARTNPTRMNVRVGEDNGNA